VQWGARSDGGSLAGWQTACGWRGPNVWGGRTSKEGGPQVSRVGTGRAHHKSQVERRARRLGGPAAAARGAWRRSIGPTGDGKGPQTARPAESWVVKGEAHSETQKGRGARANGQEGIPGGAPPGGGRAQQGAAAALRARARVEWQFARHAGRTGGARGRTEKGRPRCVATRRARLPAPAGASHWRGGKRGSGWASAGAKNDIPTGGGAHKGVRPSHGPIARGGGGQRGLLARPRRWAPEESLVPLSPAERGEGAKTLRESSASARGAAQAVHRGRRQRRGKRMAG
jgi:hypothetical protein